MRHVANAEAIYPPTRGNGRERLKDEASLRKLAVGNDETPRAKSSAAPQDDVEIEDTRTPSATASPTELAFEGLEAVQHGRRVQIALNQRNGVGKIATSAAMSRIEHDRRRIEQPKILIQPRNRGFDDARGSAIAAMRAVRTDSDCVELRCA